MYSFDVLVEKKALKHPNHCHFSPDRYRYQLDQDFLQFRGPVRIQRRRRNIQRRLHLLRIKCKKPHPTQTIINHRRPSCLFSHDRHSHLLTVSLPVRVRKKRKKIQRWRKPGRYKDWKQGVSSGQYRIRMFGWTACMYKHVWNVWELRIQPEIWI